MLKQVLCDDNSRPIHTDELQNGQEGSVKVLTTGTLHGAHGTFKAAQRSSAGTTILTNPANGGSLHLTDLILTTDKTNASNVTLQFTDDTETIIIAVGDSTNAPVNLAVAFNGRVQGWKDARLEMVTTGGVSATCMVGYHKMSKGIAFSEWDSRR